jgi:hypothetical protein
LNPATIVQFSVDDMTCTVGQGVWGVPDFPSGMTLMLMVCATAMMTRMISSSCSLLPIPWMKQRSILT